MPFEFVFMDALKFLSKASMPSILSAGVVLLPAPHAAAHGTRRSFAIPRAFLANHEFRIPRAVPFLRPLSALAPLIKTTHFRAFRGICRPGSSFVTRVTFSLTHTQFWHRQRHVSRKIPVKLRHAHPLHRGPLFASHHGARAVQGPGVQYPVVGETPEKHGVASFGLKWDAAFRRAIAPFDFTGFVRIIKMRRFLRLWEYRLAAAFVVKVKCQSFVM